MKKSKRFNLNDGENEKRRSSLFPFRTNSSSSSLLNNGKSIRLNYIQNKGEFSSVYQINSNNNLSFNMNNNNTFDNSNNNNQLANDFADSSALYEEIHLAEESDHFQIHNKNVESNNINTVSSSSSNKKSDSESQTSSLVNDSNNFVNDINEKKLKSQLKPRKYNQSTSSEESSLANINTNTNSNEITLKKYSFYLLKIRSAKFALPLKLKFILPKIIYIKICQLKFTDDPAKR